MTVIYFITVQMCNLNWTLSIWSVTKE